jgi:glycine C-acetyltransferase
MCNHPEVLEADAKAAAEFGMFYPMGARAMSGETEQHLQLERELADFVKKDLLIFEFRLPGNGFYD